MKENDREYGRKTDEQSKCYKKYNEQQQSWFMDMLSNQRDGYGRNKEQIDA